MDDFLRELLRMSLAGSLLALLLAAVRRIAYRLVSRTVIYYLWLFVLLRLCIPGGITVIVPSVFTSGLPVSIKQTAQKEETGEIPRGSKYDISDMEIVSSDMEREAGSGSGPDTAAGRQQGPDGIDGSAGGRDHRLWLIVWGSGALVSLGWYVSGGLRYSRLVRRSLSEADTVYKKMLRELEPAGRVRVAVSAGVHTPLLMGILHPVIVLPAAAAADSQMKEDTGLTGVPGSAAPGTKNGEALNGGAIWWEPGSGRSMAADVLAHELVHARRLDVLYKWFVALVTSLHWFNPVMFFIRRETDRCCELSCDETVIWRMDDKARRHYGETLLAMAGAAPFRSRKLTATLCEEKKQLKERLVSIVGYKKRGKAAMFLSVLLVLSAGGCAMISDTKVSRKSGDAATERSDTVSGYQDKTKTDTDTADGNKTKDDTDSAMKTSGSQKPETDRTVVASGKTDRDRKKTDQGKHKSDDSKEQDDTEQSLSAGYVKNGRQYSPVRDLDTGRYVWAHVVSGGKKVRDRHGNIYTDFSDYSTQTWYFETLDKTSSIEVRRFDNLLYSAGEYLIFEYDGMVHVSRNTDLYHPVLSYEQGGTYGIVTKVPDGYMVVNELTYEIRFYNRQFQETKVCTGLRAGETGNYFEEGLMAVRDMTTGLSGYMNRKGKLVIPCIYAAASDFSNGYASVLTSADMVPYTEEMGTVAMYYASGGQWGIIGKNGRFALKPSPRYANESPDHTDTQYVPGVRRFGPVRRDGTVDFIAADQDDRVLETVRLEIEKDYPPDTGRKGE